MKKFILSALITCFTAAASLGAQGNDDQSPPPPPPKFEDHILSSEIISHPLLEKVFPGVVFKEETSGNTCPPSKRIICAYDGILFEMPHYFNSVYARVPKNTSVSLNERLEAFIRLKYWTQDPAIKILLHEEVVIVKGSDTFNHRFVIEKKIELWPKDVFQKIQILIIFKRDQIMRVEKRVIHDDRYGNPGIFTPVLINSLNDSGSGQRDVLVNIGGATSVTNEMHRENPPQEWTHYYVTADVNGALQGNEDC